MGEILNQYYYLGFGKVRPITVNPKWVKLM